MDFSHRVKIDQLRSGDRIDLSANEVERSALAARLGLDDISRLDAHAVLERDGPEIRAHGRIAAAITQSCVITGDPVSTHVDAPFDLRFVPSPADPAGAEEEIELGEDDCDVLFHDGAAIDVGAAIADTLALAIDPYPRSAGAEAALREAGVKGEGEAGPFGPLADLLKGRDGAG